MLFNTPDLIPTVAAVAAPFESYQSLETADGRFGDLSIFALDLPVTADKRFRNPCIRPTGNAVQNNPDQSLNFTLNMLGQFLPVNKMWLLPRAMPFSTPALLQVGHNEDIS